MLTVFIADVFIQVEEELYQQAEANGGWRLFKPFKVVRKEQENELVASFYLEPEDGKALPPYQPGQYITVKVKAPEEEYTALRHYTVSQAPNGNVYRISVKREAENNPKGVVSNYLHDYVEEGSTIQISAPAGLFTLQQNDNPVLFIGGGIGVTPLYAMLDSMEFGRNVTFIQSVRNEKLAVFQDQIQKKINELKGSYFVKYSDTEGYITKEDLSKYIQENTEVYICGPEAFMETVISYVRELGVSEDRIHFEFFGPGLSFKA